MKLILGCLVFLNVLQVVATANLQVELDAFVVRTDGRLPSTVCSKMGVENDLRKMREDLMAQMNLDFHATMQALEAIDNRMR